MSTPNSKPHHNTKLSTLFPSIARTALVFRSNQIDLATNMMKELISRLSAEPTIANTSCHQFAKIVVAFGMSPCNL
jgi:hypothetical protein